jgi:hypothetical protein
MGIDPTASTITLLDPETGKGRVTYLCEGQPTRLFQPTPGLWFSNQSDEVRAGSVSACGCASARGVSGARERRLTRPARPSCRRRASPPRKVFAALEAEYKRDPYPSDADLERIAQKVNAPGVGQVRIRRVTRPDAMQIA